MPQPKGWGDRRSWRCIRLLGGHAATPTWDRLQDSVEIMKSIDTVYVNCLLHRNNPWLWLPGQTSTSIQKPPILKI